MKNISLPWLAEKMGKYTNKLQHRWTFYQEEGFLIEVVLELKLMKDELGLIMYRRGEGSIQPRRYIMRKVQKGWTAVWHCWKTMWMWKRRPEAQQRLDCRKPHRLSCFNFIPKVIGKD